MSEGPFGEVKQVGLPALFQSKVTKERIAELSSAFLQPFINGDIDPLKCYIEAKAVSEYFSQVMEELAPMALKEAEKRHKNECNIHGIDFEVTNGAKKYDFSHDEKWCQLEEMVKNSTALRKSREDKMIKSMSFFGAADEFGEVVPPAKLVSAGKTTLRVTIPKK